MYRGLRNVRPDEGWYDERAMLASRRVRCRCPAGVRMSEVSRAGAAHSPIMPLKSLERKQEHRLDARDDMDDPVYMAPGPALVLRPAVTSPLHVTAALNA